MALQATFRNTRHHLAPAARARHAARRGLVCPKACSLSLSPAQPTSESLGAAPAAGEAVLCSRFDAHSGALSAALVLHDEKGRKKIVTSSLDKTVAVWTVDGCDLDGTTVSAVRIAPEGGPCFSLTRGPLPQPGESGVPDSVYCGLAAKEIGLWQLDQDAISGKVRMNGHTGWVRSLTTSGKYLFSCGCNHLRQWDTTYSVPKEVATVSLDRGDILAIAAGGGKVFTAGADGSLRSWSLDKSGHLSESAQRDKAHDGRVTCLVWHRNLVYTASYDGSIKAWDAETLKLVLAAKAAHNGERIHCIAIGADGQLYTGGDDCLVRRWEPLQLTASSAPLALHAGSVRVLAAGRNECLVSGDANGDVAIWSLPAEVKDAKGSSSSGSAANSGAVAISSASCCNGAAI